MLLPSTGIKVHTFSGQQQWKHHQKLLISHKSKFNANDTPLICNSEELWYNIKLNGVRCKQIFEGSATQHTSFEFATSWQKIKDGTCTVTGLSSWSKWFSVNMVQDSEMTRWKWKKTTLIVSMKETLPPKRFHLNGKTTGFHTKVISCKKSTPHDSV